MRCKGQLVGGVCKGAPVAPQGCIAMGMATPDIAAASMSASFSLRGASRGISSVILPANRLEYTREYAPDAPREYSETHEDTTPRVFKGEVTRRSAGLEHLLELQVPLHLGVGGAARVRARAREGQQLHLRQARPG